MNKKTIDRLTTLMTPKQIVLTWIRRMQEHESAAAYARVIAEEPLSQTLVEQVQESIETQISGKPKAAVHESVRIAVREVLFLAKLSKHCTFSILDGDEKSKLAYALVVLGLANVNLTARSDEDIDWEALHQFFKVLESLYEETLATSMAVQTIERQYFDGHSILSRDAVKVLDSRVNMFQQLHDMTEPLRRRLQTKSASSPRTQKKHRVNAQEPLEKPLAHRLADGFISEWVNKAKAETYMDCDERLKGLQILRGML